MKKLYVVLSCLVLGTSVLHAASKAEQVFGVEEEAKKNVLMLADARIKYAQDLSEYLLNKDIALENKKNYLGLFII